MTTDDQQRILDRWAQNEYIDRLDVIPQDGGGVEAHAFIEISPGIYELTGIGQIMPNGDWNVFSPSPEQCATIHPISEEST